MTSKTIRERKRRLRALAVFWCAVLASDRATDAWSLKLINPHRGPPAIRLAWKAYQFAYVVDNPGGVACDTAGQRWARAEAMLRTGWRTA